ncbi:MAG: NAD(P)-dependent alcohol dehydrogenase [Bacteroidia bacterium]
MHAILYHKYGLPDVLNYSQNAKKPKPDRGEVLVKIEAAALNPVDCEMRKGMLSILRSSKFPKIPGSDFAGRIVEAGAGVTRFKEGDEVYGMSKTRIGGAYAEYIKISPQEIGLKPKNITMEEAASIPLAALTSLQAMRDLAHLQSGQSVIINGASGGVGVYAIQLAKAMGAETTAVCSFRNTELVKGLGADHIIDYTQTDMLKLDQKFDMFYDVYGNKSLAKTRHLLNHGGTYVSTIPWPANFQAQFLSMFSSVKGKVVLVKSRTSDLDELRQLIESGQLKPVVDKVYPLAEGRAAQEYLETRRARGKVVLRVKS